MDKNGATVATAAAAVVGINASNGYERFKAPRGARSCWTAFE